MAAADWPGAGSRHHARRGFELVLRADGCRASAAVWEARDAAWAARLEAEAAEADSDAVLQFGLAMQLAS